MGFVFQNDKWSKITFRLRNACVHNNGETFFTSIVGRDKHKTFSGCCFVYLQERTIYISAGLLRGTGNSTNLRWRAGNSAPNNRFIVPIIDDDIPELVEVLENVMILKIAIYTMTNLHHHAQL